MKKESSIPHGQILSFARVAKAQVDGGDQKNLQKHLKQLSNEDLLHEILEAKSREVKEKEELKKLIKKSSVIIEEVNERMNPKNKKIKDELTDIHKNLIEKLTKYSENP